MKDILEALIRGAADIIADALITKIKETRDCSPTEATERFHHGLASLFAIDAPPPSTAIESPPFPRKQRNGNLRQERPLTPEQIKSAFYELDGKVYHRADTIYGGKANEQAGSTPYISEEPKKKNRQCTVYCEGYRFPRAHIIFAIHHGRWPNSKLFHKNFDRLDDRIDNLVEATGSELGRSNSVSRNNVVGVKGVGYNATRGLYRSRIMVNGKVKHLGHTVTASEVHERYCNAAHDLHGNFNPASSLYRDREITE